MAAKLDDEWVEAVVAASGGAEVRLGRSGVAEFTIGKSQRAVVRIVDGRIEKYYTEVSLLDQPFVKDTDITVGELVTQTIASLGENIRIARFVRMKLGDSADGIDPLPLTCLVAPPILHFLNIAGLECTFKARFQERQIVWMNIRQPATQTRSKFLGFKSE